MTARLHLFLIAAVACSDASDPGSGVEAAQESLPATGGAYHGAAAHRFLSGNAQLTCSSHGSFSAGASPPTTPSAPVTSAYVATFNGQLVLTPPLVATTATHPLALPARMSERITLAATQGAVRTFDTELLTFELGDSTAPAMVRESPSLASTGRTTITTLSGGRYRIETVYDVWLEISLDGGGTWQRAEAAVRMTLGLPTP
jgi:hypothetical protein